MTIKELQKKYQKIEIELLLAHVLRKSKEFVFMHPDFILTSYHFNILSSLIKRREKGEPVAYILGYKDFYGLRFKVNRDVLIPRPETEKLVESIKLKVESLRPAKLRILDVGTGSGAIIISLAKIIGQMSQVKSQMFASDISLAALKVAKENANTHHSKIKFVQSDLLEKVQGDFDIIVANLPYGWNQWKNNTSAATVGLKFEPQEALFADDHGLYQIKKLLHQISDKKNKPKLVYLEFDPRQKRELASAIKKILPSSAVKFYKDFAGLWRVAEIII